MKQAWRAACYAFHAISRWATLGTMQIVLGHWPDISMVIEDDMMNKVQGRRSPRWAVWSRMTIPCKSGMLYLKRLRIFSCPWFGVYLHDIHEDDGDRDPHDHPWSFISIVLRGSYREHVYPSPADDRDLYVVGVHRRFSAHRMGRTSAHRIVRASPGLKTLILVGPRRASWGFYESDGTFVDWKDYELLEPPIYGVRGS